MAKKFIFTGILVLSLVFAMTVIACGGGDDAPVIFPVTPPDDGGNSGGAGGGDGGNTGGTGGGGGNSGGTLNGTWVNIDRAQYIFNNGIYEFKDIFPEDGYTYTALKGTYTTSGNSLIITPTHVYEMNSHKEGNNPWVHKVNGGTRTEYTAYLKSAEGIEEYGKLTDAEITAGLNQIFSPLNFTYSLTGNTLTVTFVMPDGKSETMVLTRKS